MDLLLFSSSFIITITNDYSELQRYLYRLRIIKESKIRISVWPICCLASTRPPTSWSTCYAEKSSATHFSSPTGAVSGVTIEPRDT